MKDPHVEDNNNNNNYNNNNNNNDNDNNNNSNDNNNNNKNKSNKLIIIRRMTFEEVTITNSGFQEGPQNLNTKAKMTFKSILIENIKSNEQNCVPCLNNNYTIEKHFSVTTSDMMCRGQ